MWTRQFGESAGRWKIAGGRDHTGTRENSKGASPWSSSRLPRDRAKYVRGQNFRIAGNVRSAQRRGPRGSRETYSRRCDIARVSS